MLVTKAGIAGESDANALKRATRFLKPTIRDFAKNKDGNIVFLFAFMSSLLFMFAGGAVDYTRWNAVRADMIESMDAAGLAMAQIDALNGPEIRELSGAERTAYLKDQGKKFFFENFKHANLVTDLDIDFEVTTQKITPQASGRIKTLFLGLGQKLLEGSSPNGLSYLNLTTETEIVRRDDGNIEVALVLDITGSMGGDRIDDLQTAAKEMVDIVVREDQSEWYSKLALVPYSMGVNVGSFANQARGAPPAPIAITNAVGKVGTAKNITNVDKWNPVRITTSGNHGFSNGDRVWIEGVQRSGGNGWCRLECQINDKAYTVASASGNTFRLQGVDGTDWSGSYSSSSGDSVTECATTTCEVIVTAPNHGFSNNDYIHIDGVFGMDEINNDVWNGNTYSDDVWRITKVDNNNFLLQGSQGPEYDEYDSGGSAWCTGQGCQFYYFTNADGNNLAFEISSCVSERVNANQYTDAAPSTTYVGRIYKDGGNTCPDAEIIPLSIDKPALKAAIDDFEAAGSTAGQIGIGWGWYLLSPNFGYLFPDESKPALYSDDETTKVAVIMTDGEFNTPYCNGVIADDAGSGSGSNSDHINCDATNGDPYEQAEDMCDAMKADPHNVIVYTIGFDISDSQNVTDLLTDCASGPDYVYFAATGDELKEIYRNIGSEITKLHIGK